MANKKEASNSTRDKAKQLREAQAKADQRTRNIIVAMVVVVIVAIVVSVVFIVANRPTPEKAASSLPEQFREGQPIVVSSEGVGKENPDVENLTLYFDYTCPACVNLETALRPHLIDGAQDGDYNLELQPVITSGGAFNVAATAGALEVASQAPDKFVAYHEAMTNYFYTAALQDGDTTYRDLDASVSKVAELAAEAGVPTEIVANFDTDAASAYLTMSTKTWVDADIKDRDKVATPEFVVNGTNVDYAADTAEAAMEKLLAAVGK